MVEIRAVNDGERAYFLFVWDDPTPSLKSPNIAGEPFDEPPRPCRWMKRAWIRAVRGPCANRPRTAEEGGSAPHDLRSP
jgi:hypothetical protein